MIHLINDIWAVEVPEVIDDCEIEQIDDDENRLQLSYVYILDDEESVFFGEWIRHSIELVTGKWQYLSYTYRGTEEEARDIVDEGRELHGKKCYRDFTEADVCFMAATESLKSLLIASDLDPNKNYALLKKHP